jgi:hypothetical protein
MQYKGKGDITMAMCKPDLVAAVLRQLGHEVPSPEKLTKAVFEASAELKRQNGISEKTCLVMAPLGDWYSGGLRDQASAHAHHPSTIKP